MLPEQGLKSRSGLYYCSPDGDFTLYQGDCVEILGSFPSESFDMVFADPPYFLSNGGMTCHAGKMVSVNKGKWDRTRGFEGNHDFTLSWLRECKRVMKPDATIWVSGTSHIIHIVAYALMELDFKPLNDITWVKPNPPPNLSCRYFTHASETILWASRDRKARHKFNYKLMKEINGGKQMTSVWSNIRAPQRNETQLGKHPTQKPLALLERVLLSCTDPGDRVLDPFAGSSTTGIAATMLGRLYVGIDTEESYLALSKKRYSCCPALALDGVPVPSPVESRTKLTALGRETDGAGRTSRADSDGMGTISI